MKVKEESEKVYLKLNIQKTKIMPSGPITSWQIDGETVETVADFILEGSKITVNIYFCFIHYDKAFDCVDHNKLWKILKVMGIPDHLTCLLRNLYASQEQQLELGMEQQTGSK